MVSKKNTLMPIKVKKLTFEKGHRKILTDMSCEIKAKGITIILGPNGAGKTLFLKCLHGLISVNTSEITFANKPQVRILENNNLWFFNLLYY